MDLLDLLAEMERENAAPAPEPEPEPEPDPFPLCRCGGVKGWSLEHDRNSMYFGMWVHPNSACRRPAHPHTNGIQDPW